MITLQAAEASIKKNKLSISPKEYLQKISFRDGTCIGQSYALMAARTKQKNGESGTLLGIMEPNEIRCFQLLEYMNVAVRNVQTLPDGKTKTTFSCDPALEKMTLNALKEQSGFEKINEHHFDLSDEHGEFNLHALISGGSFEAIEIGLYSADPGMAHSIVAFCDEEILLYDLNDTGLISYTTQADLAEDLIRLFRVHKYDKNPLRYVNIQGFKQAPK